MKVKNVLSGLQSQKKIKEIHILSEDKVIFSGPIDSWKATDVDMILYKREIESQDIKKRLEYHEKIFIFI